MHVGVQQIGIEGEGAIEGIVGLLEHGLAAVGVLRIPVVAHAEPGPRRSVIGIESDGALEHGDAFLVGSGIGAEGETAEVEIVSLFIGGASRGVGGVAGGAESGNEAVADLVGDLAAHGDHVGRGGSESVAPEGAIVFDVDGFERGLELVALLEIVAGDDVGNAHLAAGLLQVKAGGGVFAGGGEGTDAQRTHVAEGGGDFVGQGEAKEVAVFVAAHVLEWKNRDGGGSGGAGCSGGWPLRVPEEKAGGGDENQEGNRGKDYSVATG